MNLRPNERVTEGPVTTTVDSLAPPDLEVRITGITTSSASKTRDSFYHPEIDSLRFGAFFLVYLHHALPLTTHTYLKFGLGENFANGVVGFLNGGAYGVDVFFALSSYLITELLLREYRSRQSIDVKAFYIRRALRIWPLYFVVLFIGPILLKVLAPQAVFGAGYLASFALLAGSCGCVWWGV